VVTDHDRSLAADLGLYLVEIPLVEDDRTQSLLAHWIAKSVLTQKIVGRLRFTTVDTLYVTKYGSSTSSIEETVGDALRWLTRVDRHVRTGVYVGSEIVIRRFASLRLRPRALTECGGKATDADYSPSDAESALINGRSHEMCPSCRDKLDARGVGNLARLSTVPTSSSPRQRAYLRRLFDEGAQNGRPYLIDTATIDNLSNRDASALIDRFQRLRERDWKGDL
jgi:hypothetical protein